MIETTWNEIPEYYTGFDTHEFVVMPNHIHGIIEIVDCDIAETVSGVARRQPENERVDDGMTAITGWVITDDTGPGQARGPAPTVMVSSDIPGQSNINGPNAVGATPRGCPVGPPGCPIGSAGCPVASPCGFPDPDTNLHSMESFDVADMRHLQDGETGYRHKTGQTRGSAPTVMVSSGVPGQSIVNGPNHVGATPRGCPLGTPGCPVGPPGCPIVSDGTTPAQPSRTTRLSIPDIVHRYKTLTTRRYADGVKRQGWPPFPGRLWQRNYYEHIIRDEQSYRRIAEYIINNPANWREDDYFDA